jgi:hypothetical protein
MMNITLSSSREPKNLSTVLLGASGTVLVSALAAQFFTEADPFGSCLRFWKQLGAHVSKK